MWLTGDATTAELVALHQAVAIDLAPHVAEALTLHQVARVASSAMPLAIVRGP